MGKKMTLKEMNRRAKDLGAYDAESVFRHGMNSILSSQASLKADRENPLKYQIDRIVNDLHDIRIAENILREWYGIQMCDVGTHRSLGGLGVQLYCGIDEVAKALDREPKETNDFQLRKSFSYDWCDFIQLAERNSTEYLKAFSGNPKNYSTTYERAYGDDSK